MFLKNIKIKKIITSRLLKIFIFTFFSLSIFFNIAFFGLQKSSAALPAPTKNPQGVETNTGEQTEIEFWKILKGEQKDALKRAGAVAYKNALSYLLKTIAIDTATYIASGDEGQKPLFYTEGWGTYLTRVTDNAAGHFINDFARGIGLGNICTLNFNFKLGITLGLKAVRKPADPDCSFSLLVQNWESSLSNPAQFLTGIDAYFNPNENDLAVGLSMYSNFYKVALDEAQIRASERQEGDGIKPVTDKITGFIKSPSEFVANQFDRTTEAQNDNYFEYTGEAVADAVDAFATTLASKFLTRVFEKGLALRSGLGKEERFNWDDLEAIVSPDASPSSPGRAEARQEFASFITPTLSLGNPSSNKVEVTSQLLNDDIIGIQLKNAIDREFTIGQAVKEGLLHVDGPGSTFGYTSSNNQPDSHEGYSYNSIIILRKYRILPVGWELAAAYIKENFQNRIYSLGDIISAYDNPSSPFYHLIDDHWVLKAPDTFCRLEGPGDELAHEDWSTEKITDDSTEQNKEYDFNRHGVTRKDYCADSKSCIYEDSNGNCIYYGYCTEERSLWRFQGESCPAYYNTCQAFANADNDSFAYISHTLDSDSCSVDNVGCNWYCSDYSRLDNQWTCLAEAERTIKPCDNKAGCPSIDPTTGTSCVILFDHISCIVPSCSLKDNVVSNNSFETPGVLSDIPSGWTREDATTLSGALVSTGSEETSRVGGIQEKIIDGKYSLKMSYFEGVNQKIIARSPEISLEDNGGEIKAYTLSGKIYNSMTYGRAYIAILDSANNIVSDISPDFGCATDTDMAKGIWNSLSCTFNVNFASDPKFYVGLIIDDPVRYPVGVAWFDDVRVQPSCPQNDIIVYMNTQDSVDESKIYFDQDIKECDENDAGCHEFIRTQTSLGTNLLVNSSFEDWGEESAPKGWSANTPVIKMTDGAMFGTNYLNPFNDATVESNAIDAIEPGKNYIVSFYAKRPVGSPANTFFIALTHDDSTFVTQSTPLSFEGNATIVFSDSWQRYVLGSVTAPFGSNYKVSFHEDTGGEVHIDGFMIEEVELKTIVASAYTDYGNKNKVYLKKPPEYLECTGNPETDHSSCHKYAFFCSKDEIGCDLYTPINGDPAIPGVVSDFDRCPKECVGYQAFKQSATNFEREKFPKFFIANTGKSCPAPQAGCDEFTNLDEVSRGGEGKEYFKYMRQCQKPDNSCGTFYTWVGSDVAGYQLKVYSLKDADNNRAPDAVLSARTDLGPCNVVGDPVQSALNAIENPNCREFYSTDAGTTAPTYGILQNTISCTDQCFPYRLSDTTKNDCEGSGGVWGVCTLDTAGGDTCAGVLGFTLLGSSDCWTTQAACIGGAGDSTYTPRNECVYQAVPQEGERCSESFAGCREYKGNASANVRVVFTDDLESGTDANWAFGDISNDALAVGGHSLKSEFFGAPINAEIIQTQVHTFAACSNALRACTATITTDCWNESAKTCTFGADRCLARKGETKCSSLQNAIIPGASYLISFWAKSAGTTLGNLSVGLSVKGSSLGTVQVNQNWQEYTIGPFDVSSAEIPDRATANNMFLRFDSGALLVNYDFVTIKLVQQYSYVIKNSWKTPVSCDTNSTLNPPVEAPQFMLGCEEYRNKSSKVEYLKSFNRLCRNSAVGCEKLIDTHNTDSPFAQIFNEEHPLGRIDIPEDSLIYMVNSPDKQCSAGAQACEAFGEPSLSSDDLVNGFSSKYFINDPDAYASSLCNEDGVGCAQYVSEQAGIVYFKDPGARTCEYRQVQGSDAYGWFKTGSVSSFPDCPTQRNYLGTPQPGKSCVGGDRQGALCVKDEECPRGQCSEWTGVCTEEAAGCNAYVDPQGAINNNILANGNFEGYFKVCSVSQSPCTTKDQCSVGEECGPATKLYQWSISSSARVIHSLSGGFGNSSVIQITAGDSAESVTQGRTLEQGVLYTIFARSKDTSDDARVEISSASSGVFSHFDNSVQIDSDKKTVILSIVNSSPKVGEPEAQYKVFAGRFFVNNKNVGVSVRVMGKAGYFDDIELKKTGVYYHLAKDVDKKSCNGLVDSENGCVLFNDVSESVLTFSSLDTKPNSQPAICTDKGCDSNVILKVTPDRDCGKWLECVSGREQVNYKTGKKEVFCQQISECDSLNPINGQCNNFPPVNQTVQEYNPGSVDLIKNATGYAKIGYKWDENSSVEGYYPYSAMEQKRVCIKPDDKLGQPCIEDEDCQTSPLDHNGICQPILKVRDDKNIYESCRLYPEGGSPRWGASGPVDTGDKPAAPIITNVNNPLGTKYWEKLGIDSSNQKILSNAAECAYTKDETVFEGIYGFCVEKDPRSPYLCLNWLPVDEITGGWIGITGWNDNIRDSTFYCSEGSVLETRKVQTEGKCYLEDWYETFFTGYDPSRLGGSGVVYDTVLSESCGAVSCPPGYKGSIKESSCGNWPQTGNRCTWTCTPDSSDYKFTDANGVKWYDYKERLDGDDNFTKKHIMFCTDCGNGGKVIYDPEGKAGKVGKDDPKGWLRICDGLVKVSDTSANKGWKMRLEAIREFDDSGYSVPDYQFTIDTINNKFGAIGKQWRGDPGTWSQLTDFVSATEHERPTFDTFEGGENIGQIFFDSYSSIDPTPFNTTFFGGRERVKRLFAQSYGDWRWNETSYQQVPQNESRCVGGSKDGQICVDNPSCQDTLSFCATTSGHCGFVNDKNQLAVNDPSLVCNDNSDGVSADCQAFVSCAKGFCTNDDPDTSTFSPCNVAGECSGGQRCQLGAFGECTGPDVPRGKSCSFDEQCSFSYPGSTCSKAGNPGRCSTGLDAGEVCGRAGDPACSSAGAVCVGQCSSGSAISGQACFSKSTQTATDFCRSIPSTCEKFSFWQPPVAHCPANVRPNFFVERPDESSKDAKDFGDWCGVAPEVFNVSIQNSLNPLFEISGGSGEVTLIFNVAVDDNQLPLERMEIHWGDGQPTTVNAPRLGMRDKADAKDPFIFPHVYSYSRVYDQGCKELPVDTKCFKFSDYTIHILVKDNWGWCTCKDINNCKPAGNDGQCENQSPRLNPESADLDGSNSWIGVSTIIRVYEQ